MKAWTSSPGATTCSYDRAHRIAAGDRCGLVQGDGWRKVYCADCFMRRHDAGPDTGELVDAVDQAAAARRQLADHAPDRFDGRMAAAGKDED